MEQRGAFFPDPHPFILIGLILYNFENESGSPMHKNGPKFENDPSDPVPEKQGEGVI